MTPKVGVSLEDLRRNNLTRLLTRVHVSGQTSRATLTRELGLNRSTIGDLVSELAELGLVREEQSSGDGRSGRPSLLVSPREDVAVIAVNLEVDRIQVAQVALGGKILVRAEHTHESDEHEVDQVARAVAKLVTDISSAKRRVRLLGVGVAVPGAIGGPNRIVRFAPNLGWHDAPFEELLSSQLDLPVITGNDAKLGALAEHVRGAAMAFNDVAYLIGGVGIGGGFLVGGQPLSGVGGYAGEVGHLLVDSSGPPCRCGGVGCWETKVGENQLLQLAHRPIGSGSPGVAEVIGSAERGDEVASAALDEVSAWVGVGLRAVINVFNPEIVVLGGALAMIWSARKRRIDHALGRAALMSPREEVFICAADLGQDSALLGAAELAFGRLLGDPVKTMRALDASVG